jgi:hypothetical protein
VSKSVGLLARLPGFRQVCNMGTNGPLKSVALSKVHDFVNDATVKTITDESDKKNRKRTTPRKVRPQACTIEIRRFEH